MLMLLHWTSEGKQITSVFFSPILPLASFPKTAKVPEPKGSVKG